jgi:hypothetical protein
VTWDTTNQTFLSKERRTNNSSVGTGLVLDEMGSEFLTWKTGVITYFAERCVGGGSDTISACSKTHFILTELDRELCNGMELVTMD